MKRQILVDEYLPGRWGDDDDGDDDDDDDDKYRLVNICWVDGASHNKTNALLTGAS